jgi:hypothetical protein
MYEGSGVYLKEAPFSLPAASLEMLLEVPVHFEGVPGDHGVVKTWRYQPAVLSQMSNA